MANETIGGGSGGPDELKKSRNKIIGWTASIVGVIFAAIWMTVQGLAPEVQKYKEIRERLKIEKIDASGKRVTVATIDRKTKAGDKEFAAKAVLARGVDGSNAQATRQSVLSRLFAQLVPPSAHALIVNSGETALRDTFINTLAFNFHGAGTGTTAAAEADTGLQTELTTQYSTDNTRATGSKTNNGANVYRTVGTVTVDASATVTEWGLFNNATVGSGTLFTRIVFTGIPLAASDSIQFTYDATFE